MTSTNATFSNSDFRKKSQAVVAASRLPAVSGSVFADMARLATDCNAINLAQGYPDFRPDDNLLSSLEAVLRGNNHQYSLPEGATSLRLAVTRMFETLYGVYANASSEVTITAGATQAIFSSISGLIHAGDEVIYMSPAFECYAPAITLAGGVPICIQLQAPDFAINWDHLEKRVTPRTRMIIVNSPHNPSGRCWTSDDLDAIATIAEKYNIIVLSDEVYHNFTYSGQSHLTALSHARLRNRTIVVGSLGKTMHVTGWRVGYAIADVALTSELRKVLLFNTYAAPTPLQHAMAEVLESKDSYIGLPEMFRRKRDLLLQSLEQSRFRFAATQGTYFQLLDYSEISNDPDVDFVKSLASKFGVAAMPLSGFGAAYRDSRLVRVCFAKQDQTLLSATRLMSKV